MAVTTDPVKALVAGLEAATPTLSWNATVGYGNAMVLTFAFVAEAEGPLAPMDEAARAEARLAIDTWAVVSGVSFQEVTDTGANGAAMLRFALDTSVPQGFAAWASYPVPGWYSSELGFYPSYDWHLATPGDWRFQAMVHEVGHALGLKHPFEALTTNSWTLDPAIDTNQNTVMSYTVTGGYRSAPGPFDVAAVEHLYGSDAAEQADGITWSFDAAAETLRFVGNAAPQGIAGTHARDLIDGGGGDDLIDGLIGNDTLVGGPGRDTLRGGAGNDLALALADGDLLEADWGGSDTVDYRRATGPIQATATGTPDYAVLVTGDGGTDTVRGGYETFVGTAHGDVIDLSAGSYVQTARGGAGDDTISGNPWKDWLSGGAGQDVFDYDAHWQTGNTLGAADIIVDFQVSTTPGAVVDRIDLSTIDAIADGGTADDAFAFIGIAAFTGAGQVRAQALAAGTLLRLNLDSDAATEAMILLKGLTDAALLDAADFVL